MKYYKITETSCSKHIIQGKYLKQTLYNEKKRSNERDIFAIILICGRTKDSAGPKNKKEVLIKSYVIKKKGDKLTKTKRYKSIQKAAEDLGVSRKTIYKYLSKGKITRPKESDIDYIIVSEV